MKVIKAILWMVSVLMTFYTYASDTIDIEKEAQGMLKAEQNRMNMQEFSIDIEGNRFFYLDNKNTNTKETIVLLHGFNGDSSHWLRFIDYFRKYRVIIPELLGFGRSEKNFELNYQFESQAHYVNELLTSLNIDTYHIAGNSMGGAVATVMAYKYPKAVKSLTLVSSAGIFLYPSPWLIDVINGKENPLFVNSLADFNRLLNLATEKKPFIPPYIVQYLTNRHIQDYQLSKVVFEDITQGPYATLAPILPQITQPVLILWGANDQIINVRNAEFFDTQLPNSKKIILEKTGHLAMLERPQKMADYFSEFLKSIINK